MNPELNKALGLTLRKLEKAYEQIVKTQGYNKESEKIKILAELVKEQIPNESPRPTTR